MYCSQCGIELKFEVKFCHNCGYKINIDNRNKKEQTKVYPVSVGRGSQKTDNPNLIHNSQSSSDYTNSIIENFENSIFDEEDFLLGLKVYYKLIPAFVRWTNSRSIKKISRRMDIAINAANQLLDRHNNGDDVLQLIKEFKWPPRWKPMEDRVKKCLLAYGMSSVEEEDPNKFTKNDIKIIKEAIQWML